MRCCFGIFPITLGTMIVAGILVVAGAGSIVAEMLYSTPHVIWLRIGLIVVAVVQILAAFLAFVACMRRQPGFLGPVVAYTLILLMALVVLVVISIISLIAPDFMKNFLVATPFSTALTVVILLLYMFFFQVFNTCFIHLKESESLSEYDRLVA